MTVDPTTGEWLINGEKTGWSAKAPYIGTDGYWYCWSNKDGKFVKDSKAQGEPGTPGTPGASGADGHSPFISDGTEGRTKGYWYYWSADKKEWVKGDKATGEKGDNGYSPYIGTDGYWYFWDIEKNEWKQGAFTDATTTLTKGQDRPCWILKQGDNTVILPTADQISALKGVSIEDGVINTQDGTKEISMKYGICPEAFTFDGTEYDANQILRTEGNRIKLQSDSQHIVRQHQFSLGTAQRRRTQFLCTLKFVLSIVGVRDVRRSKSCTDEQLAPFLVILHFGLHHTVGTKHNLRAVRHHDVYVRHFLGCGAFNHGDKVLLHLQLVEVAVFFNFRGCGAAFCNAVNGIQLVL